MKVAPPDAPPTDPAQGLHNHVGGTGGEGFARLCSRPIVSCSLGCVNLAASSQKASHMPAAPTSPGEPEGTFLQCPREDGQAEIQLLSSLSLAQSFSVSSHFTRKEVWTGGKGPIMSPFAVSALHWEYSGSNYPRIRFSGRNEIL